MSSNGLSKKALAAAKRIAKLNNVSMQTVVVAFEKASKSKTRLTARLIFLDK